VPIDYIDPVAQWVYSPDLVDNLSKIIALVNTCKTCTRREFGLLLVKPGIRKTVAIGIFGTG